MAKKVDIAQESAVNILDSILQNAFMRRASDIHCDSIADGLYIRFRVDGVLYPFNTYPRSSEEEIISRIKILAQMDITEHRLPQDGHFEMEWEGRKYNLRISTVPTIKGESAVLRIFSKDAVLTKLDDLGMDSGQLDVARTLIASPHGLVLITGPTGSGKTTFLYAVLEMLNKPSRSIVTLEDPVELEMPGVRQMQINEVIDLSFKRGVRAVLRQSPDILMIGEIRDSDTAQMAFRAAMSGVLVFSTFHTFDVPGLIIRLAEMGVPRSTLAYGLTGVITTRLVRKICPTCREAYKPSQGEMDIIGMTDQAVDTLYRGRGCDACLQSGYVDRTGIFEIVRTDEESRYRIIEDQSQSSLRDFFKKKTLKSLRASAIEKVLQGVTTTEEILHVIGPVQK